MNDYRIANILLSMAKTNNAFAVLNIVCKNCQKKKCKKDCNINRAKMEMEEVSGLLYEEVKRRERMA